MRNFQHNWRAGERRKFARSMESAARILTPSFPLLKAFLPVLAFVGLTAVLTFANSHSVDASHSHHLINGGTGLAMAGFTKEQIGNIYKPVGPKQVAVGNAWTSGGKLNLVQQLDLSLPVLGIRIDVRGRIAVATANYTAVDPEGVLNMIQRITVTGINSSLGGNVTLADMDGATAWALNAFFTQSDPGLAIINNSSLPQPNTPWPSGSGNSYFLGTTAGSPYDFRYSIDVPFHPHGIAPIYSVGFAVRSNEYKNTVAINIQYGTQVDNAEGCLGVSAATTVTTFSQFGAGGGTPIVDVYSLPFQMGPDMANTVVPGLCSRVQQPITNIIQAAGGVNTELAVLQAQNTARVYFKIGTSTLNPFFATLSDTNVTTLGILIGGNKIVRENDSIWTHKQDWVRRNGRPPIQGYNLLDFLTSGNPFSCFPAGAIPAGTRFSLVGTPAGVANAYALVIQEQLIIMPSGSLYGG